MKSKPILVIEDHVGNRELLSNLLEVNGYEVVQAATATMGVELAKHIDPGLILMDLSLPGMDGLAATRLIKSHPGTAAIPVIAVTANAFPADRAAAMAAGCIGFISKPIDTRMLVPEIERILKGPASG
jgi:CheY-like chemotaxis protein